LGNLYLETFHAGRPSQCIEAVLVVMITNTWGQTMSGITRPPSRPLALRPRLPALRLSDLVAGLMCRSCPAVTPHEPTAMPKPRSRRPCSTPRRSQWRGGRCTMERVWRSRAANAKRPIRWPDLRRQSTGDGKCGGQVMAADEGELLYEVGSAGGGTSIVSPSSTARGEVEETRVAAFASAIVLILSTSIRSGLPRTVPGHHR
jgi:hypothetical protein